MKFKRSFLLFFALLVFLCGFCTATVAVAKGSSANAFPNRDENYGNLSPSMEVIAFNAAMGPSSQKWKNVDKSSLPALENFRSEYFTAKYKLPERVIGAMNDSSFVSELDDLIAKSKKSFPKSFRVLAIGNSFSKDAAKFLSQVAKNAGAKNVVIATMHIPSCDLKTHRINAEKNLPVYKYNKTKGGKTKVSKNVDLLSALKDEKWDYITLQQSSPLSGIEKSYNRDLDYMISFVLKNRPKASTKLCWHMTWTFSKKYRNECYSVYNFDQTFMYDSICTAVKDKILSSGDFSVLIPVGTAIQNLRTSYIGDRLNRDGRHLNDLGKYTAAMTFVRSLGFGIDFVSWIPKSEKISKAYLPAVKAAVNDAISSPLSLTNEGRICNHSTAKSSRHNTVVILPGKAATCKSSGLTQGSFCKVCKQTLKKQQVIERLSKHKFVFTTKAPATLSSDGEIFGKCKVCGQTQRRSIPRIKSVTLSKTAFTFNKKAVNVSVTVKDSAGNLLRENTDYTVSLPSGRKEIGKYTVKVTFKNNYSGKAFPTFSIVPPKTSIKSAKPFLKGIALVWNEQENISGYIIEYGADKDFSAEKTKRLKVSTAATGKWLNTDKKGVFFVRIKTYKNISSGNETAVLCSAWSKTERVEIR